MAVRNPPSYISARTDHTAYGMRRAQAALARFSAGVTDVNDLLVSQRSGTQNMSVDVAAGGAFVAGTEATYQGFYHVEAETVTNVTVAASTSLPRNDLIVARVRDAQYSGSTNAWALEAVTGTAAASPVDPAVPANSLVLARVSVGANVGSILNAAITDLRSLYGPQPTTFAQVVNQGGVVTATQNVAQYIRDGRKVDANFYMTVAGLGNAGFELTVNLPVASVASNIVVGSGQVVDVSTSNVYTGVWVAVTTTTAKFWYTQTGSLFGLQFQLASGDVIRGQFSYFA